MLRTTNYRSRPGESPISHEKTPKRSAAVSPVILNVHVHRLTFDVISREEYLNTRQRNASLKKLQKNEIVMKNQPKDEGNHLIPTYVSRQALENQVRFFHHVAF